MPRFNPILAMLVLAPPALAQSNIDPVNKFCWQENSGWMNWRDAEGGLGGAIEERTYLIGFVWAENLGWINLGSEPGPNGHYANATDADFGVNIAIDGTLSGFAWSENGGWINFSGGALASPGDPARLDLRLERLRGFAWCENMGWINLDLPVTGQYVQRTCYPNCDQSTAPPILNANDFQCFLNKYAAADPYANCDHSTVDPVLNANDFQCFLNAYAAGCP